MPLAEKFLIQKAAVLGAGVMGAQIAAHLTHAGIQTILFDLASDNLEKNTIIRSSILALKDLKPLALGVEGIEKKIQPANYDTDLEKLESCDLVIEVIAENADWKQNLYTKISPFLKKVKVLATNTSSLSIEKLSENLSYELKRRFCGIHFFNPPRYMKLVEVTPNSSTDPKLLRSLEAFLVSCLGKGVIFVKDTPNFIGNRIGVYALLVALYHSEALDLSPDMVDALTGTLIGRPKSATFKTLDIIGLDMMAQVVETLHKDLTNDPWRPYFHLPHWVERLIERGALGQKQQKGFYQKVGSDIHVFDPQIGNYRLANAHVDHSVIKILKHNAENKFKLLNLSSHPQAQFLWRCYRDLFHYCAYHAKEITHYLRDIDLAMRWGYAWQEGPFEMWQSAGWHFIKNLIVKEIAERKTMSIEPLPHWALKENWVGPYNEGKVFSLQTNTFETLNLNPIYQRQYFLEDAPTKIAEKGKTIFETPCIRLWTMQKNIAILSFKPKQHLMRSGILLEIHEAIEHAEKAYDALIFWQRCDRHLNTQISKHEPEMLSQDSNIATLNLSLEAFQKLSLRLKYASVPTIAIISGTLLGRGCQLTMHHTKVVAAFETRMGLVEAKMGLLPAGGGCKEFALRASQNAVNEDDLLDHLKGYFKPILFAQKSTSALDAKRLLYLQNTDRVVMNENELLYFANLEALSLADMTYHPPLPPLFPVAGAKGKKELVNDLSSLREAGKLSETQFLIGTKLANVLCGGDLEAGHLVNEDWILNLEREAVIELAEMKKEHFE